MVADWELDWKTISAVLGWMYIVVDVVLRILALAVVPYNRRPAASMAWLLAIMIQPIAGWIIFLVLGNTRLPRSRRTKMAAIQSLIGEATLEVPDARPRGDEEDWLPGILRLNRRLSQMPHMGGNAMRMHWDFDETLAALVAAIDAADESVNVEFYLIVSSPRTETFFAALERARSRGVTVRVLVDHLTSIRYPGRRETIRRLDAMGAQWRDMLPLRPFKMQWQRPDLRNHRKLMVVDGVHGFTGSLNLIDPTYLKPGNIRRGLEWRDAFMEITGPVALELDALFMSDWWAESNELIGLADPAGRRVPVGDIEASVVPSGPGFEGQSNLRLFTALMHTAVDRITIVSPYFVPDDSMSYAITTAAMRGVKVELFASEIGDQFWTFHAQRSYYEELLRAGVSIWLYRPPVVLHSKLMLFDDRISIVGSSNIDMRSFNLNFEVSMLLEGEGPIAQLDEIVEEYRSHSTRLELEGWQARPRIMQIFDNVARLTSALQ